MALTIQIKASDSNHIVSTSGDVDLYSSPELRKAILQTIKLKTAVAVDLSGVAYMDSSGVATLIEGLKLSRAEGRAFTLVRPSQSVLKVLQLARLDKVFDILDLPEGN